MVRFCVWAIGFAAVVFLLCAFGMLAAGWLSFSAAGPAIERPSKTFLIGFAAASAGLTFLLQIQELWHGWEELKPALLRLLAGWLVASCLSALGGWGLTVLAAR
jgi:hypothetical protein